jgi:hypothetical protein
VPAPGAEGNVWQDSQREVKRSHILLVLYTGEAGWAKSDEGIGICHAEFEAAMNTSPDKVRIIKLPDAKPKNKQEAERNERFKEYVEKIMPMRSEATTGEAAIKEAKRALRQAVAELTIRGAKRTRGAKFDYGAALDWSRLDFGERQHQMINALKEGLMGRKGTIEEGNNLFVSAFDKLVFIRCNAIPASTNVPSAREMVGQPFLHDYRFVHLFDDDRVGPVHLIACSRTISEAQAMKQLGFPDATIVTTSFGVYVADNIQKIQLIFLANCRDKTNTLLRVDEVFRWLNKSGEEERLVKRATARKNIICTI